MLDDATLIRKFQGGDKDAMEALVRRHQDRAYQYAYRLTRSAEEAGDVVADAFLRIYKAIDSFKFESAFTTWMHRIVTNCYLDLRKKAMARPASSLDAEMAIGDGEMERQIADESALNPHAEAERGERERIIGQAVAKLPEYQKAIITMYHVEMLSYEEIAESLDLPIGTVKSRLNRARNSLRVLLSDKERILTLA
ncbi:sigma-70 family RNA polymerase sigma factor [bacterium]|nr:MAG: sigma-70 family RNA polymerase sigma factor [bacterium]